MASNKGSIQKTNSGSLNWFKNVSKSLGYTSSELVRTITPSISEFARSNVDYAKELTNDFREMKSNGDKFGKLFNGSQQLKIASDAYKNALEDIKSGNIHNQERIDSLYDDDFNMDGFGMEDFSFDGDSTSVEKTTDPETKMPSITIKNITPPMTRNNPMVKAVEKQTEMQLRASQTNMEAQIGIATNNAMLSRKMGTMTIQGLETINDNLGLLINFQNDSMSKYIGASLKYYEESLNSMNATLKELQRSNGTGTGSGANSQTGRTQDPMDNIFLANGGLDLRSYMSQIKKNVDRQFSENMFLQPLKMMFSDTDTLKSLAASPLSFISTKIVTTLIPQFLQTSMQNLDKSFSTFFPALMMKINRAAMSSNNPFIQILGEIFGATTRTKTNIDLSKYNRGQIPFDGETKKSIVEVIPGYLRKILAAVSGQEEVAFDYNDGKFKTVSRMKQDFDNERNMKALSPFMDAMDDMKKRSDAFLFDSMEERKKFNEGISNFFVELNKQGHLVNPNLRKGKDGSIKDELSEVYNFDGDKGMQNLFRQLILTMPKNQQMKMFGRDVIDSRRAVREMMEAAEANPTMNNVNVLFNELGLDDHLQKKKDGSKVVKKGFGLFNPQDKFGKTSLDYLRDINRTLLEGIRVFPLGGGMGSGGSDDGSTDPYADSTITKQSSKLKFMNDSARKIKKKQQEKDAEKYKTLNLTPEQLEAAQGKGQKLLGPMDLANMSPEDITKQLEVRADAKKKFGETSGQQSNITQWLGQFFKGDTQEKYNLIREKIDGILKKPAEILKGVFDRVDNTLYNMVFGKADGDGSVSFFDKTLASLGDKFESMGKWVQTKVFEPIKESLIGENGIITKMKDSEFYKSLKDNTKRFADWMFGKPDSEGVRRDGLLADTGNNILDMWDAAKYYFNGKGYVSRAGDKFDDNDESVLNQARGVFKQFGKDLKHYLVGDKKADDEDNKSGVLTGAVGGLKEGFVNFRNAIFGPKEGMSQKNAERSFEEMKDVVKQRAPKALAWGTVGAGVGLASMGSMGLMGSLFLPGGPIGAAVVGTTLGFLSQSDRFKNWMFGEKNANNERIGGVIGKSTQDFFKKNRAYMVGGATLGVLKPILGAGILPSFLLPGGPIAGALFGIGTAMLVRSEGFQKMMFGEKDEDGKRTGGLLQRSFSKFKGKFGGKDSEGNNLLGNMGAGALGGAGIAAVVGKLGLMGAMLTPAGPIGGAVLGAAAGIALSSDRWKKALFGEWDDKTGLRQGGMLGKFTNWFTLEVQEPLKNQLQKININFQEWFTTKISNPFADAIAPMKQAFKDMTEGMADWFKKGWDGFKEKIGNVFEENVGKPFGKFMNENVMKPLKGFLTKIIMGAGKIFAPIAEAPVKVLSAIGNGFRNRQERRGVDQHVEDGWNDMSDYRGRRERGERMGMFSTKDADGNKIGKGVFGRMNDMYFNKEARDNARFGEHGASYAREEDAKIAERNQKQADKFKAMREALETKERKLDVRRRAGYKHDYDNFDEEGNDISRIYNITKSKSGYQRFVRSQGEEGGKSYQKSIGKHLGVDLADILQVADPSSFDASNLSKAQRKIVQRAIKSGLTGNALKKFMGIKNKPAEEETAVEGTDAKGSGLGGAVKEALTKSSDVIKSSVETMTDKMSSVFKETSAKEPIEKTLVPEVKETNSRLTEIASRIGEVLGSTSRVFKVKKTGSTSSIPRQQGGSQSPEDSDDDERLSDHHQLYADKMDKRYGTTKLDKQSLMQRIATDVRIIASEVRGQLDGVGGNVFKMRKLLQHQLGMSDDDMTGSANRDRIGLLGRFRRLLFKPFDALREKITQTVGFVVDKVRSFGEAIFNVGKAIVMVPVNIVKGVGKALASVTKEIFKGLKAVGTELIKLPGKVIGVVGSAFDALGHAIKAVGPAVAKTLEGAASFLTGGLKFLGGALKGAGEALHGFGKGVGKVFVSLGEGASKFIGSLGTTIGKITSSIGSFLGSTIKMTLDTSKVILGTVGKTITGTAKVLTDFTLNTVKQVGDTLTNVGKAFWDVVSSPFKFISKALGKMLGKVQEVKVTGGTLDLVKEVGVAKEVTLIKEVSHLAQLESYQPVDSKTLFNEHFIHTVAHAVTEGIKALFPLPVFTVNGGTGGHDDGPGGGGGMPKSTGHTFGGFRNVTRPMKNMGRKITGAFGRGRSIGRSGIIKGSRAGSYVNTVRGALSGFLNKRKSILPMNDKIAKLNVLPSTLGNIIPFPDGKQVPGLLSKITGTVFGAKMPNLFGEGSFGEKMSTLASGAPKLGRNANDVMSALAEKEEQAAVSGFRISNVGLLSMIESNTRRMTDIVNPLLEFMEFVTGWLKKFKPCCGLSGGGGVGSPGGGGGGNTPSNPSSPTNPASPAMPLAPGIPGQQSNPSGNPLPLPIPLIFKGRDKKGVEKPDKKKKKGKKGKKSRRLVPIPGAPDIEIDTPDKDKKDKDKTKKTRRSKNPPIEIEQPGERTKRQQEKREQEKREKEERRKEQRRKLTEPFRRKKTVTTPDTPEIDVPDKDKKVTPFDPNRRKKTVVDPNPKTTPDTKPNTKPNPKVTPIDDPNRRKKTVVDPNPTRKKPAAIKKMVANAGKYINNEAGSFSLPDFSGGSKSSTKGSSKKGGALGKVGNAIGNIAGSKKGGALGKVGSAIGGLFGGKKAGKVASVAGDVAGAIGKNKGVIKGVGKGVLKTAGKVALGVGTLGIGSLLWGAADAAAGSLNAADNFGVSKDKVTGKMRTASGAASAVTGFIPGMDIVDGAMGGKIEKSISQTFLTAMNSWDSIKGTVTKATDNIKTKTGEVWGKVKESTGKAWDTTKEKVGESVENIKSKTSEVWGNVKETTGKKWEETKTKFSETVDGIKTKTADVWNNTKETVGKKWEETKTKFSETVDGIKKKTSDVWTNTKETVGKKWDDTKTKFTETVDGIKKKTSDVWSKTKTSVGKKWDDTKTKFTETVDGIKKKTGDVWNKTKTSVGKKWDDTKKTVTDKASGMYKDAKDKFESAKKTTGQKWNELKTAVTTKAQNMKKDADDKWENAKSQTASKLSALAKDTAAKAQKMKSEATSKWESAKSQTSSRLSSLASDAGNKAGGIKSAITSAIDGAKSAVSSVLSGFADSKVGKAVSKGASYVKKLFTGGPSKETDAIELAVEAGKQKMQQGNEKVEHGNGLWGMGQKSLNGMVYYSQNDPRWANKSFTGGKGPSFAEAGCGPTTAAMVMSSVTGKEITPMETLQLAQQGGFTDPSKGTRSDFFASAGKKYGVNIQAGGNNEQAIKAQLAMNKPVILRGQGGKAFTEGGHYVVATGLNKDGKIMVNDPMGKQRSVAYEPEDLLKNTTSSYAASKQTNFGKGKIKTTFGSGALVPEFGRGVFDGFRITSPYGWRQDPGGAGRQWHRGIDLVKADKADIKAFANGEVVHAKFGETGTGYGGYGNVVAVKDERGYTHLYAHLSSIAVRVGDKIKKGRVVGKQGNTGRSFGSHLHYEVRQKGYGTDVDPTKYLQSYVANKDFVESVSSSSSSDSSSLASTVTNMFDWRLDKLGEAFDAFSNNMLTGSKTKVDWTLPTDSSSSSSSSDDSSSSSSYTDASIKSFKDSKLFKGQYADIINKYAKANNMEPALIAAIIKQESGFNAKATSPAGARGLMQLMPSTASSLGVSNSYDPDQNVKGGSKYVRQQLNSFKDVKLALAAYNAGPGNVRKYGNKVPPFTETQNYVKKVVNNLGQYRAESGNGVGGGFEPGFEYASGQKKEKILENQYGIGRITQEATDNILEKMSQPTERVASTRSPETVGEGLTDSYMTQRQYAKGPSSSNLDSELLKQMVGLLEQISGNTKSTTEGLKDISVNVTTITKKSEQVTTNNNSSQQSSVNVGGGARNANPMVEAANTQQSQGKADYSVAKSIAGGNRL